MSLSFAEVVEQHTGAGFVDRGWLRAEVEAALDRGHVLVTGEPGAGKTSLLAALAEGHPDWLRYFARRDSRTTLAGTDVQSFLLAVGHQLARQRPEVFQPERLGVVVRQRVENVAAGGRVVGIRIEDLTASPFHRTAVLEVEQRLGGVAGSVSGVEIGRANLEPRLLEPDNLAHLALLDPAEALHRLDPAARIVILVDALDELAGSSLLDWLAGGPELPSNVRLVLSSRPHAELGPLRLARALTEVPIDPGSGRVTADLLAYAGKVLSVEPVASAVAARGELLDQFHRNVVTRAAGNFLYLATYARALAEADPALTGRLLGFDGIPPGLDGLYGFFVETARADLRRLGQLEIREPTGPQDRLTDPWLGLGQPILGVLTVAREPVSTAELLALGGIRVWPRAVRAALSRLRWLLAERADRISLYHASIGEFLRGEAAHRDHPDCAVDETEWHQRIAAHYRGGAPSWSALDWSAVDRYGLLHLAEHVTRAGGTFAEQAAELVCPGLRQAIAAAFGSDRHFARCVDLVAERMPPSLPGTLYLGVVRRQLRRTSRGLTPRVLGLMARLGQVGQALDHLWALPPSLQQFQSAREIHRHAGGQRELMVETALTIPADQVARGTPAKALPLEEAALEFAADDLPRALRLWAHAQRGQSGKRIWAPDALYRAAARVAEPLAARALLGKIRGCRAGDWLDLAARLAADGAPEAGAGAPDSRAGERGAQAAVRDARPGVRDARPGVRDARPGVRDARPGVRDARPGVRDARPGVRDARPGVRDALAEAVAELARAQPGERLLCLARLAVAQPERAREHLARLIAEAAAAPEGKHDAKQELAAGLVCAAAVPGLDPVVAERLLARLETFEVCGFIDDSCLSAVRLLAARGATGRAMALLERVIRWNGTLWTRRKASVVVAEFDPVAARGLLDPGEVTPAGEPGSLRRMRHEGDLSSLAIGLAPLDLPAALATMREMTDHQWSIVNNDRWTTAAVIGQHLLDSGRREEAEAVLAEVQRDSGQAPALVDVRPTGPYRVIGGAPPDPLAKVSTAAYQFNHTGDWMRLRERRFHRDPAEVVRAMSPDSWSVGNPHTWGRVVRVLAETIAETEPGRAAALVDSLVDAGERAIGLAALGGRAAAEEELRGRAAAAEQVGGGAAAEETLGRRASLAEALGRVAACEWLAADQDAQAFAYVRADHRVRFEVAVRMLRWGPEQALEMLEQSGARYLTYACALSYAMLAGFEPPSGGDPLLVDIVRARQGLAGIEDPLYAVLGERAGFDRLRELFGTPRLPAAAGLIAYLAESHDLRGLAVEAVAAARASPPATGAVALLQFARCPALADLVDPAELHAEALRLDPRDPLVRVERDEVLTRLFPVLLGTHPALALGYLYQALTDNWDHAMALLEHAAVPITSTLGPGAAGVLHERLRLAVACVGEVPGELDGVR
ncbi:ATP-binding protein [Crossiella sp. SN42]|uniref:ATP-binding protein n=1 Tax=Crossiella sp. SN42 TaxID=2944808 RepID=UPI00207D6878|nr:ATP-binding protein [Crossiella sp. SN42]MCO1575681.1 ATP-binding protein [Crossiella sp. SN42]